MFSLYVWPGKWDLPSIDHQCLAAILYLQLAVPGRFQIVECANPDLSPSGSLPFLQHELRYISPLSSIIEYVAALDEVSDSNAPKPCAGLDSNVLAVAPCLDAGLSSVDRAQSVAWKCYVETQVGDLVLNAFYASPENYNDLTLPTLNSFLRFPQTYYVPGRIREMYRPRLEAADLWDVTLETPQDDKAVQKWKDSLGKTVQLKNETEQGAKQIKDAFTKEKVLQKARTTFGYLASLIPSGSFIHGAEPTTLDVLLAAHILVILHAPLPKPLLKTSILSTFPSLIDHALLLRTKAFPSNPLSPDSPLSSAPSYQTTFRPSNERETELLRRPPPPIIPLDQSIPSWRESIEMTTQGMKRLLSSFSSRSGKDEAPDDETEQEKQERELDAKLVVGRRLWWISAPVVLIGYIALSGMVQIGQSNSRKATPGDGDGPEAEGDFEEEDEGED